MNPPPTSPADSDRDSRGYRVAPGHGPRLRADVVDAYIVRRPATAPAHSSAATPALEFLQLHRAKEPLRATWQPVMGHVEPGETAPAAAARELREEVGLDLRPAARHSAAPPPALGFWALEQVHPFYIAAIDCIVLSPRFLVEVDPAWRPRLNAEHSDHRWVAADRRWWLWPGQWAAVTEITTLFASAPETLAALRLPASILSP